MWTESSEKQKSAILIFDHSGSLPTEILNVQSSSDVPITLLGSLSSSYAVQKTEQYDL